MAIFVNPVINPLKKWICPACGNGFYPGECAIYSGVTTDKELEPARRGMLARAFVQPLIGHYTKELAHRHCPSCNQAFPYNIERAKNYTIAIIGDVSAGKSHYIAACIQQLKYYALHVMGYSQVEGLNNTDEDFENKYYRPVFVNRQQIPPTQQATEKINSPLVYELIPRQKPSLFSPQSINLLFYDASGEDIAQKGRLVQYSPYIVNASAIIFLADPLTMPAIVRELPRYLQPKSERRSSAEVFQSVIHTFKNANRLSLSAPVKTPVAIAISKSDLLKYVTKRHRSMPLFLKEDSAHNNGINVNEFKQTDEEVQAFLRQYGDTSLIDMAMSPNNSSNVSFEQVSFFAISATGFSPDENTGRFPTIEPFRCLDPLLWALWKLEVVGSE